MKRNFKVGDIVRYGKLVSSIKRIEDGRATLVRNYEVALERLEEVEINGAFDHGIVLDSVYPLRAHISLSSGHDLKPKVIPYIENSIDGKTISSVIEENGFTVVTQLQDWISDNKPDFFLRMKCLF